MNTHLTKSNGIFDDFFRGFSPAFYVKPLHGDGLPEAGQFKVDVKETNKKYEIHAEIPGVSKENIDIAIDRNLVTIQAEIAQHDEDRQEGKLLKSERYYGSVSRSFTLPTDVDADHAKASYEQGVLVLTLPKKEGSSHKHLTVE
ncbi:Hsp20/alpha crystallin family protein [Aquirhabdus sp.]|uniref:Hsp20/alpha crystallin family protein n=1 Tax=Aquirhabdus sp. TaxID=2824160 RepID=UPI00396C9224